MFQRSIDHDKLPNDWLNANVSCIFKKGDKHAAENNRPVSLTSVPCKLLEYIICGHMMKHLEKHNVLTSLNHVFRSGYSYETQLVVTIHDMLQSFQQGKQVDLGILNFSKAFDTVPHDRLQSFEQGKQVDLGILSFSKAFNTVPHDRLQSFEQGKQVDLGILNFSKAFGTVPHDRLKIRARETSKPRNPKLL
jgi:hypothetical protein